MEPVMPDRTMRSRGCVAIAALLMGVLWAAGGLLPLGAAHSDPLTLQDQVRIIAFSLMLASFGLVAWITVELARPSRLVLAVATAVAIGGVVAGIGNFAEDWLRIAGGEYVYGLGLFTLLIGLIVTTIVLLVRRDLAPALLVALSIAGFMIAAGRGPNLLPVVYLGLAAWVLVRRPVIVDVA